MKKEKLEKNKAGTTALRSKRKSGTSWMSFWWAVKRKERWAKMISSSAKTNRPGINGKLMKWGKKETRIYSSQYNFFFNPWRVTGCRHSLPSQRVLRDTWHVDKLVKIYIWKQQASSAVMLVPSEQSPPGFSSSHQGLSPVCVLIVPNVF